MKNMLHFFFFLSKSMQVFSIGSQRLVPLLFLQWSEPESKIAQVVSKRYQLHFLDSEKHRPSIFFLPFIILGGMR